MNIFDVQVELPDATTTTMANWAGHCLLVVNTASECGYTPQLETLQELFEEYAQRGFFVIVQPCNQFGGQEPGSNQEIAQFCTRNFGVEFPILAKADVNGPHASALFQALKGSGPDITWNFEKFVVSPEGEVVGRFDSATQPDDMAIINLLEEYLPV
ncbi:glutathione peroxidase [Corynebacterium sp. 153RC1]|uniref:glutathione peroxidase n=1 Tax=unclassified Corynebacterium TaxID=2624378 RepID=UPI00211BCDB6|nr:MULTISPECIES: glutathione peroxidase [unclassified Corynebacterium]MCQ9371129.1 glutathione peroxidase [Corynebacterium sp. 35RC1]MCQ9353126.1 glutathione peroxidase [Corynebacterium sp. 209RC1]MCQ9355330.1 glutathione peroxidase [Corynebacterium sp. 1222RC1]MCQ9357712.1 glutathione peroxidase [Corynebacterium sp. 122RC1]MCQ9359160.1 glutathione peroxidase [Corynebacterium sp. 142RC1]